MSHSRICTVTATDVVVRGESLPRELMGHVTFTEMAWLQALGERPTVAQTAILDACLCALMEHGLTPTVQAARLTYVGAPESIQGAVAAGLLGVGGRFAGSMEDCGRLLVRIVGGEEPSAIVLQVRAAKQPLPGFGHPQHRPTDPRADRLFEIAHHHGVAGFHTAALVALGTAIDGQLGRHLLVNATGAFAAVLLDAGAPVAALRGFALVARCAGLVGHLLEEQASPTPVSVS